MFVAMPSANLIELFSSVQGEGLYVGHRQVFVRFAGCNLRCAYCDTPASRRPRGTFRAERTPGARDFQTLRNPVSPQALLALVLRLETNPGLHHSVSLTGGEPLLHADFLRAFLPMLAKGGLRAYLETNGTLPQALRKVIRLVDIVAMDIKLPSATRQRARYHAHAEFLKIAARREAFVKVVVTARTTRQEVSDAARLIARVSPKIPLVLQPASANLRSQISDLRLHGASPTRLLELQALAQRQLETVCVIPQTHKLMGQL